MSGIERSSCFVVVSGSPGSGKTTLARALAPELGLPLLAKDTIKETLFEQFGAADIAGSQRLGGAAIAVLLAVARDAGAAVLESTWRRTYALPDLTALGAPIVEVFCRCDPVIARERYLRRAPTRSRRGHFDEERAHNLALWRGEISEPIAGPWPVIEVDTQRPMAVADVAQRVRLALA